MALYSRSYCLPKAGEVGEVIAIPTASGRRTCMPGLMGGLVYVRWAGGCMVGVPPYDIKKTAKRKK
jgi:hypothetical protein